MSIDDVEIRDGDMGKRAFSARGIFDAVEIETAALDALTCPNHPGMTYWLRPAPPAGEGGGKYRPIGCTCQFMGPQRLRRFGCPVHPGPCTVEQAWEWSEHKAEDCFESDCPFHGVRARREGN